MMKINGMKRNILFFALIISFFAEFFLLYSQENSAITEIDTNNVKIGEQIKVKLKVKLDSSYKLIWTQLPKDSIGKIEIISVSKVDTIIDSIYKLYKQELLVTSFDSGSYEIPSFNFLYEKAGFDLPYPISTNPMYLNFATVEVDTTLDIKDIKGPLDAPWTFEEFLPYLLIFLGVVLLIWIGIVLYNKFKKSDIVLIKQRPKPTEPAHIIALRELRRVESQRIWTNGKFKEYHSEISEIIRTYIEHRFNIIALEMTTQEINDKVNEFDILDEAKLKLRQVLELSDLAKFAKYEPIASENELCVANAIEFVNLTAQLIENSDNTSSNVKKEDF